MPESATTLSVADYVVIAGFFGVMLAIGVYFSGRMRSLTDYFGGGRRVPWWLSGTSLYMSSFSAFTFVAYSELAYKYGLVSVTIWWFMVPCVLISAYFFAARWRRAASTSPLEYIETRYGPGLRQGLAWMGVPLIVIDDGLKLFAIGTLVSVGLGFDLRLAIFLSGTIMLTYTFLGGLWAVMVTDFIQFVVMMAAVIVLVPLAWVRVGGFGRFFEQTPEGFFTPTGGDYTWAYILAFAVASAFAYATKWPYVQRYYAVRTDSEARKVGYLVAVLTFLVPAILFFPAMAARIFLPDVADTKNVYALLCKLLLPAGMVGMIIAAMFSATMSMLSSDYNAVASVMTNDIYRRFFGRKADDRSLVRVGRVATLVVGVVALGIAFLVASFAGKGDLFKYMARLVVVLIPPMAIPMMFGLLSRRVSNAGGIGGLLFGSVAGITAYGLSYTGNLEYLRTVPYLTPITTIPTILGVLGLTWLRPNSAAQQVRIDRFLGGLESVESGVEPASGSPARRQMR